MHRNVTKRCKNPSTRKSKDDTMLWCLRELTSILSPPFLQLKRDQKISIGGDRENTKNINLNENCLTDIKHLPQPNRKERRALHRKLS